jgi:glycine/D-amino acid oxidase-like deaminating enzyme
MSFPRHSVGFLPVRERANVLIAGGGVVGASVASALARRGVDGVVVVDLDLAGVYASSELNAGGARATWWQRVNVESCRRTLDFFREHAETFGFRELGYLWLYDDPDRFARAAERRGLQNEVGLGVELLTPGEIQARCPLLDRGLDELVGATFSPRDGLVNPNAVRAWYRRDAERLGVVFRNRHYVSGIETALASGESGTLRRIRAVEICEIHPGEPADEAGSLLRILTTHRVPPDLAARESSFECETFVNCLGAWSPLLSAKIGVRDVTEPVRRQISLVDVRREDLAPGVEPGKLGMVVDASGLYLHPEGRFFLAGYSPPDDAPGYDFSYDGPAFFERELWPRLAHRASSFERCGHVRGWSGLYAVTPDCSGIVGAVAGFTNLYEAHSFTGRGVMQSWSVGSELAALIASGRYEEVDLSPLSRERFADPTRWVREDLHI